MTLEEEYKICFAGLPFVDGQDVYTNIIWSDNLEKWQKEVCLNATAHLATCEGARISTSESAIGASISLHIDPTDYFWQSTEYGRNVLYLLKRNRRTFGFVT